MATEHVLELVRREVDLRLPSRLDCSFFFARPELAALYRRDFQLDCTIYECEGFGWWVCAEGNKVRSRVFSEATLTVPGVRLAIEQARRLAQEYWTGQFADPMFPEILVDGAATYKRELSTVSLPSNAAPPPPWVRDH
jgi:hypothetical protein